jgi:hypothetical protein
LRSAKRFSEHDQITSKESLVSDKSKDRDRSLFVGLSLLAFLSTKKATVITKRRQIMNFTNRFLAG